MSATLDAVPMRTKAKLRAAAEDHITVVACEPDRVKAYFQDPKVKYAAWIYLWTGSINCRCITAASVSPL